jgi:small-conductance mechanosensitive channel
VQNPVKNYTFQDSLYRLRVQVGVTYGSDMKLVRETLERTATETEWRNKDYDPSILMTGFGDSSVNFEVSVWIDDPWTLRRRASRLHEAIWWALKEAGVVIAFPQLDVHFDPPIVESLTGMARTPEAA